MPIVVATPSATSEALTFDPVSESADNSPLEIQTGTDDIQLVAHTYPAPPLDVQYAGSVDTEGDVPASRRYRNRTITLQVDCLTKTALDALEAKVAKIGREGGTLQRVLANGETVIFDLLAHDAYEGTFDELYELGGVTAVALSFPARPFGRGPEQDLGSTTDSGRPAVVFTETAIPGTATATGRLVVSNGTVNDQYRMWWGIESRTALYLASGGNRLFYEAEDLTPVNGATVAVGSSGASLSVVKQTALTTSFVPQLTTEVSSGSVQLSHVGSFRVLARVYCPASNAGTVQVRLQWAAPDTPASGVQNTAVTYDPAWEGTWRILDLGMVTARESSLSTQAWLGYVDALSSSAGDDIELDWLMLVPVDVASGEAVGVTSPLSYPVLKGSGSLFITHEEIKVVGATVVGDAPPQLYEGDYLRIPPSGSEGRQLRGIVKVSRGDDSGGAVDGADAAIDDVTVHLYVTPRYLVVPDA